MVLLMISFFEAFDLFEVLSRTFAIPSIGQTVTMQQRGKSCREIILPPAPSILEGEFATLYLALCKVIFVFLES